MSRHLINTPAKARTCPGCSSAILTAHEEGFPIRVDAEPITAGPAEVAVLLTGRMTFTQSSNGELIHRTAERIQRNFLRGTIHAEHVCPQPELAI